MRHIAVSQVVGFIKGKSAIHLARVYGDPVLPEISKLGTFQRFADTARIIVRALKRGDQSSGIR